MPAFNDTIGREHTTTIVFSDGFAPEIIRHSGLSDMTDNTFEHTVLPSGRAFDLPSGRTKIGHVILTMLETGGVRQHFANIQARRQTIDFTYSIKDYEGNERDAGTAVGAKIVHTKLNELERNADGAVTCEVEFTVTDWS